MDEILIEVVYNGRHRQPTRFSRKKRDPYPRYGLRCRDFGQLSRMRPDGHAIFTELGIVGVTGVNLTSIVIVAVGAMLVLVVYHLLTRQRAPA